MPPIGGRLRRRDDSAAFESGERRARSARSAVDGRQRRPAAEALHDGLLDAGGVQTAHRQQLGWIAVFDELVGQTQLQKRHGDAGGGQALEHRAAGAGVLLISEDLDELLELSDRIVVLNAGAIVADLDPHATDRFEIGALMIRSDVVPAPDGEEVPA